MSQGSWLAKEKDPNRVSAIRSKFSEKEQREREGGRGDRTVET
jgi:hypothetical protein